MWLAHHLFETVRYIIVADALNQALLLELHQSLADNVLLGLEGRKQVILDQSLARPQPSKDDILFQLVNDDTQVRHKGIPRVTGCRGVWFLALGTSGMTLCQRLRLRPVAW